MTDFAFGTLARSAKGPVAPPLLDEPLKAVAASVAARAGMIATARWDLEDHSRIDGIDFYEGEQELSHIHLDGSLHLATSPSLGAALAGC